MAWSSIQVDLYLYPVVINLGSLNQNQIQGQADTFLNNINTSTIFRSFNIVPSLLESHNTRYSEKQVKRIDENFYDYCIGTKFRLNVPIQTPPRRLRYLIRKYFSGDVSGDIGEALFAYFLIEEMRISPNHIGHTRPLKAKNFVTPDFVIWDVSKKLAGLLNRTQYQLPVLGEVKGFTGNLGADRIGHGLTQLKAAISNSSLLGILFLAARNEIRQNYDVYVIRVRT